jgi:hypothetical protein
VKLWDTRAKTRVGNSCSTAGVATGLTVMPLCVSWCQENNSNVLAVGTSTGRPSLRLEHKISVIKIDGYEDGSLTHAFHTFATMGLQWSSIVSWCLTDRLRVCAGLDDGSVALYDTRNMTAAPAIKVST